MYTLRMLSTVRARAWCFCLSPDSRRAVRSAALRGDFWVDVNQYVEIRRCFNRIRQGMPAASRVTFEEFAILCELHEHKGLSATQVAENQNISCPTMTHRGSHLSELGYLGRTSSNDDHRRLRCLLSRKGSSFVSRTIASLIDSSNPDAHLSEYEVSEMIPIIAKMGSLSMPADSMALLCFEQSGEPSLSVMRIVEMTALLQPTVSMAILRLEDAGCIETPELTPQVGRRLARRNSGCVITEEGRAAAEKVAEVIFAL